MLEVILAPLPYQLMSVICTTIAIDKSCRLRIKPWQLGGFILLKVLMMNVLIQTLLHSILGETRTYTVIELFFNIFWVVALMLFFAYYIEDSLTKSFTVSLIGDMFSMTGLFLADSLCNLFITHGEINTMQVLGTHTIFIIFVLLVFVTLYCQFVIKWYGRLKTWEIKHKKILWVIYTLYFAITLTLSNQWSFINGQVVWFGFMLTIFTVILTVTAIIIYQKLEQRRLYKENRDLLFRQQLLAEYNDTLCDQLNLTRKLRHDIGNHIQTMDHLLELYGEHEEIVHYASSLREQYNLLLPVNYCNNILVNSVLCNKVKLCKKENIDATVSIRSLSLGNISEMDILGILYNMFDNAIEGTRNVKDIDQRFLDFTSENIASQLVLNMRNSIDPSSKPIIKNGKLATTKKDSLQHGVGITIIEDTVKKYNGSMKYHFTDNEFQIMVILDTE